jgi:hypothetical protein
MSGLFSFGQFPRLAYSQIWVNVLEHYHHYNLWLHIEGFFFFLFKKTSVFGL